MSPPEPALLATFGQTSHMSKPTSMLPPRFPARKFPVPPPSPPTSPHTKPDGGDASGGTSANPLLYPTVDNHASSPPGLFAHVDRRPAAVSTETDRLVSEHIAARPAALFHGVPPPAREDYELALYFKSDVMRHWAANPRGWLRRERAFLRADATSRRHARPLLPAELALEATSTLPRRADARVAKTASPKRLRVTGPTCKRGEGAATFVVSTAGPSTVASASASASAPTPHPNPNPNATRRVSGTPEPARARAVAPNREDKDFAALPDCSPPAGSLPAGRPHCLRVEWKGSALDLSGDPHRHLLHAEEVALAAGLRLDCATYLTSKRRIFARRLECARIGKEFRKTDAQQACKIDVNKASKLWTAYERVGWLDGKWMKPFL
ncbi:hypothetical protein P8C59_007688 [Phyllachora maydis]|uniref:SWIRM domain-containing protein n=1 Tax=Phyllachora maydis TaxID=1825666 RepID=A0AAD9IA77_9PEZI|nr:hypothetical protein P8C59_007688 [Phyllachora maydis]